MKKFGIAVVAVTLAFACTLFAEDVVHAVSGIVKSVDKTTKTMVVKDHGWHRADHQVDRQD